MKKYISGIIAIVIAVGALAFTMPHNMKYESTQFKYVGPTATPNYTNEDNWIASSDPSGCSGSVVNCLVTPDNQAITTTQQLVNEISVHGFDNITINAKKD